MDAPQRTGGPDRLSRALESRWALPALALTAFALSLLVQRAVYPGLSWNRDEGVYLWHVEILRAGQLSTTDGGHPSLFQPWLSASLDGRLFSQYTLGWPLALLAGALLGSTDLTVAAGAALAVIGTWALVHELRRDRQEATVAATFMLASPILSVQGGMHLNYLFTLGLGLLMLVAALSGVRLGQRWRLLVAGGLLGWVFLTRPYDAAIWGLVAAVALVAAHRRRLGSLVGPALWGGAGLVPLVAATLLLNRHLTGSLTEFPITVADPLDQFGFGTRRLMPGFDLIAYGPGLALSSTGRNAFWLPFFVFGVHLGVLVAAVGAWGHRRDVGARVLVGLGIAFPAAYFAFFGTHISSLTARLSGPIYYIPAYAALSGLMAIGVVSLARRRPRAALLVVAALVAATAPVTASRLRVNHELSEANLPWARSVEGLEGRALVVPSPPSYLLFINPFGHNGADLDGRILYAAEGPALLELLDEQPDRAAYLQRADLSIIDLLPSEHPRVPQVSLTPMEVVRGDVRLIGTVDPPAPGMVRWLEVDGVQVGALEPVGAAGPVEIDLRSLDLRDGLHTLEVKLGEAPQSESEPPMPSVRRIFYLRAGPAGLELLSPGTAARFVLRPGAAEARWENALSVPELVLDARVADAG